jgi:hypothetical protein
MQDSFFEGRRELDLVVDNRGLFGAKGLTLLCKHLE